MTKSDVTKRLKAFSKAGLHLHTMNSHRSMPTGMKGHPDHLLLGRGWLIYVEVKLGRDKPSYEQQVFADELVHAQGYNPRVRYFELHESNAENIFMAISKCISKRNGTPKS